MVTVINNQETSVKPIEEGKRQDLPELRARSMMYVMMRMSEVMGELSQFDLSLLKTGQKLAVASKELADVSHNQTTTLIKKMKKWNDWQQGLFVAGLALNYGGTGAMAAKGGNYEMLLHGVQGANNFHQALSGTMQGISAIERAGLESEIGMKNQASEALATSSATFSKQMSDGLEIQAEVGRKIHELLKAVRDVHMVYQG